MCKPRKFLLYFVVFMLIIIPLNRAAAEQPDFDLTAHSAILMEAMTGEILFSKNPDKKLPPASMTKIMTMLLIMEAVDDGRVNLSDKIVVSERAASMGGSQVYLEPGEEMTLEQMMKAVAISSANDASVAVAEYVYGTEERFIKRMNERATELGMKNTYFYNTNGLPTGDEEIEGNYTTAYDLSLVTREILKYPKVFEWTSTWIDYLRDGDFVLNNTNRLVRHYQGADGLKTGYTSEAKFCVTSTAQRDNLRFISVIMGADSSNNRFKEAAQLLSYGFNIFKSELIAEKNQVIKEIDIWNARSRKVTIKAKNKLSIPIKKGKEEDIEQKVEINEDIKAPLEKGSVVGKIKVFKGNLMMDDTDLIIDREVKKASFLQLLVRLFKILVNKLSNLFF